MLAVVALFPHPFCTRKLDATECVFEKQSRRFALSHFVGGRRCVRSVAGSLTHRHVRCSEVLDVEPRNMLGPFYSAAQSGSLQKHESFASRAPLPALNGRPLDCTMPCETRWQDDRSLFTGVVHGGGSAHDGQDADLRVAGWELANTAGGQPVSVSKTLPYFIQDVDGFLRIALAPAQYVTDSSFAEQGVNQHGWKATEASTSAVARRLARGRCLGDSLSVRKIKAHTDPRRYARALSLLRTRLVMTWLMLLASWWFWSTVPREAFERRGTRPTWPSHAWLTGSRVVALRGSDGTILTCGYLGWSSICWTTRACATLAPAAASTSDHS